MLFKCSGKYIDIYFSFKITFYYYYKLFSECFLVLNLHCFDGHWLHVAYLLIC